MDQDTDAKKVAAAQRQNFRAYADGAATVLTASKRFPGKRASVVMPKFMNWAEDFATAKAARVTSLVKCMATAIDNKAA